jgi:hypothetical protein
MVCCRCCLVILVPCCCLVPLLCVLRHRCAQFAVCPEHSGSVDLVVRGPCLLQDNLQRAAMAAAASAVDEATAEVERLTATVRKAEDQADKAEQERLPEREQAEAKAALAKAEAEQAEATLAQATLAQAKLAHASAGDLENLEVRQSTMQEAWRPAVEASRPAVGLHSRLEVAGDICVCVRVRVCLSVCFDCVFRALSENELSTVVCCLAGGAMCLCRLVPHAARPGFQYVCARCCDGAATCFCQSVVVAAAVVRRCGWLR